MKLNKTGNNETIVTVNKKVEVLFSYNTPVAACVNGIYSRTDKKWSATTSRHINKYLDGISAETKSQDFFDELVK